MNEITVTIPALDILAFLGAYMFVGLLLFVPLVYWQVRFIAPTSRNRSAFDGVPWVRAILAALFCWPIILGWTIKTEVSYRKKGLL